VISSRTVFYFERATYATDSEVKTWIKDDALDQTPITVMAYGRDRGSDQTPVQRRVRRDNDSERSFMLDDFEPAQTSTIGTEPSTMTTRALSTSSSVA
jgi:hypothetical protein